MFKDNLEFVCGALWRSLIVVGLVFFGQALESHTLSLCFESFELPLIVAGGYLFLELSKKFKVKVPETKNKKAQYSFLLLP